MVSFNSDAFCFASSTVKPAKFGSSTSFGIPAFNTASVMPIDAANTNMNISAINENFTMAIRY